MIGEEFQTEKMSRFVVRSVKQEHLEVLKRTVWIHGQWVDDLQLWPAEEGVYFSDCLCLGHKELTSLVKYRSGAKVCIEKKKKKARDDERPSLSWSGQMPENEWRQTGNPLGTLVL